MIQNPKFIILLYHKIGKYPQNAKFPGLYVAEEDFDRQIKYLKNSGYTFLTLSELKTVYDYYSGFGNTGSADRPSTTEGLQNLINGKSKYATITFDDGSKSVYSNGLKVMAANGVKGVVFMVSGLIGGLNEWDIKNGENRDEMLNIRELKEMINYGIELGAHTKTHPHLTQIDADKAFNEIAASKKELENLLGININFFAYPYGDFNEEVETLVKKAGFLGACITKTGIVKKGADFFALRRVAIRHNTDFFKFKRKIFKVKLFY
ncbi:MAG: polysaccharide deacetylase family protein [Deltaproteobacteria bacterium]|jgi:peptidoglycan/xylan/chitin deacetylase (PgdA/CDA1 family)|nr:polysaccharide deacetylase family protein [Deltaproteobacteria bacterium]MCL5880043.1 polysaccharide deacetylase family protein [Deltaproteobacteria bacterium]MDA8304116.1 polysaccharide deacetylase family protein [Deltaproteobacteria bacterium]